MSKANFLLRSDIPLTIKIAIGKCPSSDNIFGKNFAYYIIFASEPTPGMNFLQIALQKRPSFFVVI